MKGMGVAPAPGGKPSEVGLREEFRALRGILPYLWPRHSWELRTRVLVSIGFLVAAKGIAVFVPMLYKRSVDALSPTAHFVAVPIALIVAYGIARIGQQLFVELRDAVFAKVGQRAVRLVALSTFRHLHHLSLRFHLDRQTGGLSRAVERGVRAMEFLLSYMLFSVVPTLVEILLVCGILWGLYNATFAVATFATVLVYVVFTFLVTDWRVKFRREMNERDGEANTKAIDSLLNFETVKYFANEEHEARRFDEALQGYERASVKSQTTLSMLNVGQGIIISGGLVVVMLLAARGVIRGTMTVGDFVLVNSYLVQLYTPLNVLGMVYRNIKQSMTDLEAMFRLLAVKAEVQDQAGAPALAVGAGEIVFDRVSFRRAAWSQSSARAAPANRPSAGCCSASTMSTKAPS
jgi:ATP-binding cassette subfamily B protein